MIEDLGIIYIAHKLGMISEDTARKLAKWYIKSMIALTTIFVIVFIAMTINIISKF